MTSREPQPSRNRPSEVYPRGSSRSGSYRWLLWLAALLSSHAVADQVGYGFPLSNPLAATIIGTPADYRPDLPDRRTMRVQERRLPAVDGREVPEVLWFAERLRYSLARQDHEAPLVFVIAGTGTGHRGGKMDALQQALYQAGFHVVSLPSPTHGNFITAASTTGLPGYIEDDAADLYEVMQRIWDENRERIEVSRFFLTGYSLGGAQAAFVSRLDEERGAFGFEKVLMICPPVSLYASVTLLDQMLEKNIPGGLDNIDDWLATLIEGFAEVYRQGEAVDLTGENFLYLAYRERDPSDERMAALIGFAFRISAANMVFVSDVSRNSGFIKPKEVVLTQTTSLTDYAKVALRVSFLDYYHDLFLPFFQARDPGLTEEELIRATSLKAIEGYLRGSEKIGLMTNADEIILSADEIEYLRDVFGPRAIVYPTGGHCGNIDYAGNVDDMVRFFGGDWRIGLGWPCSRDLRAVDRALAKCMRFGGWPQSPEP